MTIRRHLRAVGVLIALASLASACSLLSSPAAPSTTLPASPQSSTPSPTPTVAPGLAITPHTRTDLSKYSTFSYDSAVSVGLNAEAAAAVDAELARLVDPLVAARVAADADGDCEEGIDQCGLFDLVIKPEACDLYLCAVVTVSEVGIGAGTSNEEVYTRVFDPRTGRVVGLNEAFGGQPDDAIVGAAQRWQDEHGFSRSDWRIDPADVTGWVPAPEGLRVWFAKYTIASGAEGVVELFVPYSGGPSPEPLVVGSIDEAANWLCSTIDVEGLPELGRGSSDTYAVSVLQRLLVHLGYPPEGMPVDGQFGSKTAAAVRQWQTDRGLVVDGVVGPQTWSDLQIPCEGAESDAGGGATSGQQQSEPDPALQQAQPQQAQPQQAQPQQPAAQQPVPQPSVVVPDVVGLPAATAESMLRSAGLRMSPPAPMASTAYIQSQAPPGGSRTQSGAMVSVFFGY